VRQHPRRARCVRRARRPPAWLRGHGHAHGHAQLNEARCRLRRVRGGCIAPGIGPVSCQPRDKGVEVHALAFREDLLCQAARFKAREQFPAPLRVYYAPATRLAPAFVIHLNFRADCFHPHRLGGCPKITGRRCAGMRAPVKAATKEFIRGK
jgi:hypothetical protein